MLSEALKLAISALLLIRGMLSGQITAIFHDDSVSEFFSYAIPAGIYFVNNNCIFFILQAVDPTTFQLLSQMKTIFTGLLSIVSSFLSACGGIYNEKLLKGRPSSSIHWQ